MPTVLHLPLGSDSEARITLAVREYDGIASDPGITEREPTLTETFEILRQLRELKGVSATSFLP